jgi:hypothetical protein
MEKNCIYGVVWMTAFFYILFGIGVLYSVITFLLGQLLDFMDVDIDFDDDGLFDVQVSPFKPMMIATFLTTFGGLGLIFQNKGQWHSIFIILVALAGALTLCAIIYFFVMVPLYKAQNTSAVAQSRVVGYRGRVTISIREGKFGKITYTINGNTYSAPAKSFSGKDFGVGEEVLIIDIQKNVYYVDGIKKGGM